MLSASYVIVIDGEVDANCAAAFAPNEVTVGDRRTTVATAPIDQAALHGILNQLASLGLPLVSVASSAAPEPPADARA